MSCAEWKIQPEQICSATPVMPVLVIHDVSKAIALAEALFSGGIHALEVTLRTPVALEVIRLLTQSFPDALIGAGTVTNSSSLNQAIEAGAKFAISPGQTRDLLMAGLESPIPLIPGVATISEMMEAMDLGYTHFKLFPAVAVGGVQWLKSVFGPFPGARFCPTGGINAENFRDYLALPNVSCVGGSWIVPDDAIRESNWSLISELCLCVG